MPLLGPMSPRGFRRRGRRRGLIVGAAAGAAVAHHAAKKQYQNQSADDQYDDNGANDQSYGQAQAEAPDVTAELEQLQNLKARGLITEADYDAKKKQILGI